MANSYAANNGSEGNSGLSELLPKLLLMSSIALATTAGDRAAGRGGDTFRELCSTNAAAAGAIVTSYASGKAIINGSDIILAFTGPGPIWDKAVAVQPNIVWVNGVLGVLQVSRAACTAPGHWFWTAGTLSVYSVADPSGFVEAGQRDYNLWVFNKANITVSNLILEKNNALANNAVLKVSEALSTGFVGDGLEIRDACGGGFNCFNTATGGVIRNSSIYRTGMGSLTLGVGCGAYVGADNWTFEYSAFDQCGLVGSTGNHSIYINITGTAGTIIRYNTFDNCTQQHILVRGPSTQVYRNTFRRSVFLVGTNDYALATDTSGGTTFYHNTVYALFRGVQGLAGQVGIISRNNIFANIENRIYDCPDITGSSSDYNIIFPYNQSQWGSGVFYNTWALFKSGGLQETNGINVDPLLVNPSVGDLRIQRGSPGVNKGVVIQGVNNTPRYKWSRPDIGYWESPYIRNPYP